MQILWLPHRNKPRPEKILKYCVGYRSGLGNENFHTGPGQVWDLRVCVAGILRASSPFFLLPALPFPLQH